MVDPTSDLNENISEDDAPDCETCGTVLVQMPTHRVITWVEDGEVQTVHFCDEDCLTDWQHAT